MSEQLFAKNIALWSHTNPKQAVLLQYRQPQPVKIRSTSTEGQEWFKHLDLKGAVALFIFGVGKGDYYPPLKEWLKKDRKRRAVFLEDDLNVLRVFLGTEQATALLQDPQVQLLYFENLEDTEAVFEVLYWNFAMRRIVVSALEQYAQDKKELYENLRHKIAYDSAVKNALVDEYLRYGGAFFVNFYQNMLSLPGSYLGNKTFGSFKKVPAIICGAGPSLVKSLPQLKGVLDRALVFAGGSALNALNAAGIQPHLGAGIDPNPAQYARLSQNKAPEVPFYYRNRMYHDAFERITGPRLYVTGCGGYDVSDYFEEALKISDEFLDEGHNVINFCLQIAWKLGCDPIIFAGMDLAFTGMKMYAPGIEENVHFDPDAFGDVDEFDEKPLLKEDIYGEPLYTLWKWVAESDWIGEFGKEHSEITLLNATEGGLGFPGIPNLSFKEAIETHLLKQYPIADRLQAEIQNSAMPQATLPRLKKLLDALKSSLKRCAEAFEALLEEAEEEIQRLKKEKKGEFRQSGRSALLETELMEEPGYQYVLDIFNQVLARLYNRDLQEERSSPGRRALKKWEINQKRYTFLRDLAKLNVGLIDRALEEQKKKKKPKRKVPQALPDATLIDLPKGTKLPAHFSIGDQLPSGHRVSIVQPYGKPIEEAYLTKDGALDGEYRLFYPDGKIKAVWFYKKGMLEGPATFFTPDGQILTHSSFKKGTQVGVTKWFTPDGELYSIQHFPYGHQLYLDSEGKIKSAWTSTPELPLG